MRVQMRRLLRRRPSGVRFPPRARRRNMLPPGRRYAFRAVIVLLLIFALVLFSASRITPTVELMARAMARERVILAVSEAVRNEVENGNLEYARLVTFEKDDAGNITALVTNSALINILQARISRGVVENIETVISSRMSIPIGSAIGGVLLSGRGPRIPVKIQSVTDIRSNFVNDFSSTGINQTRHKIMLEISVDIDIIIPGSLENTTVMTEVAIAETVIVGVVPNVYAELGRVLE